MSSVTEMTPDTLMSESSTSFLQNSSAMPSILIVIGRGREAEWEEEEEERVDEAPAPPPAPTPAVERRSLGAVCESYADSKLLAWLAGGCKFASVF